MKKISIIGMGYVGLPLAISFQKYFKITGFDINKNRIQSLKKGIDENKEFSKKRINFCKNLIFTNEERLISNSDIFIITVPTPIFENKKPDLTFLKKACLLVGRNIKKNNIVVFESTVYPGCTEEYCAKILEKTSKKKLNKDFFLAYSPERINVGDKKNTLENIIKIVGASNKKTLRVVTEIYSKIIKPGVFKCESIKVAESAKAIENAQRDINIAFVNEVGKICKKLNINLNSVLKAASTKWNFLNFKPGLVGGHCIGVDPYYLRYIAKKNGIRPQVIDSGRYTNDNMYKVFANDFLKKLSKKNNIRHKILVLGIAFKENTNDLRNSKVFDLCDYFRSKGNNVFVYDPLIKSKLINKNFKFYNNLKFQENFDGIFFAVPHDEILNNLMKINKFLKNETIIYDLKSVIPDTLKFKKNVKIIGF